MYASSQEEKFKRSFNGCCSIKDGRENIIWIFGMLRRIPSLPQASCFFLWKDRRATVSETVPASPPDTLGLKLLLLDWNYYIADTAERMHLSETGLNLKVLLFCFKVVCSLYGHNLSVWSCIVFCQHEASELKYTVQHSSSVNSWLIYAWINVLQPLTQGEVGIQLLNWRFSS